MSQFVEEITLTANDRASSVFLGLTANMRGFVGQIAAMAGVTAGLGGLGMLAKQGIDFNKTMEDSKGGIAGVLLMTRQYVDAAGKVVTGQGAMNAAFSEASGIQEKLKKDALGTAASYTELVGAFQTALAPAAAAGVTNLDDVREITVMATQAMAALNIPTAQAAQELRGLFAGDMGPDNRLNQILRVSKADLKALGGDAEKTAAFFREKLGPAASAAAMQTGTLTVRMSNLGDIMDQVMGDATAGLFKEISSVVAEVTAGIEKNKGALVDMGETIHAAFSVAKETLGDVFRVVTQDIRATGTTGREVFQALAVLVVGFVESVGAGMKWAAQLWTSPLETVWGAWKTLIFGILSLFSELVAKFKDVPVVGKFFGAWSSNLDAIVVSMTTVDQKFANFEKKASGSFGGGAFENARKLIDSFAGSVVTAGEKLDGLASKAKKSADDVQSAAKAMAAKFKAEAVPVFSGFWSDYLLKPLKIGWAAAELHVTTSTKLILRTVSEWREQMRAQAERLFEYFSDSASAGAKAGMYGIFATLPSTAESAANAVQGIWQSMARSFDDSFYSVLTGRLDSLKDVFKSLWDSLLRTFSQYLSDMLQRWIATQMKMGETSQLKTLPGGTTYGADGTPTSLPGRTSTGGGLFEGGWGALGPAGGGTGGWAGAAAGAGIGLGIGSIVGQFGSGKLNQVGGSIGGMVGGVVGSLVPGIGTLIGALIGSVVGTLIGALASSNTERHVISQMDNAFAVATKKWVDETTVTMPNGGERTIPGHWQTVKGSPQSETELQMRDVFESQATRMFDMFRVAAKDKAAELFASYQKTLRESLIGATVDIAAGSEGDIQKATEALLKKLLPRISLSAAFGQTGFLPNFDRDAAGGIGNLDWNAPALDLTKQLYDPEAPIPKMLTALGLTARTIGELAGRISTEDPEKLLSYIEGLVGVLVEFKRLGTAMGQTVKEVWAGFDTQAGASTATGIATTAQEIADLFDVLETYSGDAQLSKTKEAQQLSAALRDSVLDYLAKLKALADQLSASIQAQRVAMRDFLSPQSDAQKIAGAQGTIDSGWGALLSAQTPDAVNVAAMGMQKALDLIFGIMAERITRGKALIESLGALDEKLGTIGADVARAQLEQSNPLAAWGEQMADIQAAIAKASKLSGLEQIAALEDVGASAEQMYSNLKGFLADIANVSASINKSIDSQIWELGVGEMGAKGQASAITDRIRDLQEQLKLATSPAEIQAISSEIQSLTGRYIGQFGKDDPNRAAAIAWAQEELERTRSLANETLDLMREQAKAYADELKGLLAGSVTMISTNVGDAADAIGQLSQTLGELDRVVREQLERLGTAALDALAPLRTAMDGASTIFTGATGDVVDALTAPETGLEDSTKRVAGAFDLAGAAIVRFIAKLDSANVNGASSAKQSAPLAQKTQVTARDVIPLVRRYSGSLTPRTY